MKVFPMIGQFFHRPTPEQQDLIRRMSKVDEPDRVYASAVAQKMLADFIERRGAKTSLRNPIIPALIRRRSQNRFQDAFDDWSGADHSEIWNTNKGLLYTSQPYQIKTEDIVSLAQLAQKHDLDVVIHAGSYYFPSATMMVEVRKKTAPQYVANEPEEA